TPMTELMDFHTDEYDLTVLEDTCGITRAERQKPSDPVGPLKGPVIDRHYDKNALANGLWVGEVPGALNDLSFAERLLIAR
ncbi:hypothetical protein DXG01_014867, partial [Tephrocybe rancida]